MCHGEFGHLSINSDSRLEGFDKLLLLYRLDQSEKTPLGRSECELCFFCFVFLFKMLQASRPRVYLFNAALQYVVKRLDSSWFDGYRMFWFGFQHEMDSW